MHNNAIVSRDSAQDCSSAVDCRIAIYLRDLTGGGVEKSMLNLAQELLNRGWRIDILVETLEGAFKHQVPASCRVIVLDEPAHINSSPAIQQRVQIARMPVRAKLSSLITSILRTVPGGHRLSRFSSSLKEATSLLLRARGSIAGFTLYIAYLNKVADNKKSARIIRGLCHYTSTQRPVAILTGLEDQNFRLILVKLLLSTPSACIASVRNHLSSFWDLYHYSRFHEWGIRTLYPMADHIVCVSNGIREDLVTTFGVPPGRARVIYNPVVNESLKLMSSEPTNDDDWLSSGLPVILGAGRLHKQKGFDDLLKAFALLRQRVDARLIIIGSGPEHEALQELIAELGTESHVRLSGFQSNPFAYMSKASVFVLSSRNEGLPGVLIQAMACGCPVVSTDCRSGPAEILENGRLGRLVPVGDTELMAEAIAETLCSPCNPEKLTKRADDFDASLAASKYLGLIHSTSNHVI